MVVVKTLTTFLLHSFCIIKKKKLMNFFNRVVEGKLFDSRQFLSGHDSSQIIIRMKILKKILKLTLNNSINNINSIGSYGNFFLSYWNL